MVVQHARRGQAEHRCLPRMRFWCPLALWSLRTRPHRPPPAALAPPPPALVHSLGDKVSKPEQKKYGFLMKIQFV